MKKIPNRSLLLIILVLFLLPFSAGAFDFGLLLDQTLGVSGEEDETEVQYQATLVPRFSMLIGENGDLFLSGGLTAGYNGEEGFFVPEFFRNDLSWRFGSAKIQAGRMLYTDPVEFVANGLFDGAQFSYDTRLGTFNVGAWYTGLLYKKKANIIMTADDQEKFDEALE